MAPKATSAVFTIRRDATDYPEVLTSRLGEEAPDTLVLLGNRQLLEGRKIALLCSAKSPGDVILRAHDTARRMRDERITVISGFHSPIEKECLKILLRGKQPIIACPARAIEAMRISALWRAAFEAGRVLFLSPFVSVPTRVTRDAAIRRNKIVAALADQVYIAHMAPGSETAKLAEIIKAWRVPLASFGRECTDPTAAQCEGTDSGRP